MKFSKFFSNLQEAPWYREFLNPVMDKIDANTTLLDIGTGSGKMLEILSIEKNVKCTGTDTNQDMLNEAKGKLKNTDTELHLIEAGKSLPFEEKSFDYVTICSVLFHLKEEEIDKIVEDSLKVLKEKGKLIILTPTGKSNVLNLTAKYFSLKNTTIYVWYNATKKRARKWSNNLYLKQYSTKNNLDYQYKIVMNGFAQVEILS